MSCVIPHNSTWVLRSGTRLPPSVESRVGPRDELQRQAGDVRLIAIKIHQRTSGLVQFHGPRRDKPGPRLTRPSPFCALLRELWTQSGRRPGMNFLRPSATSSRRDIEEWRLSCASCGDLTPRTATWTSRAEGWLVSAARLETNDVRRQGFGVLMSRPVGLTQQFELKIQDVARPQTANGVGDQRLIGQNVLHVPEPPPSIGGVTTGPAPRYPLSDRRLILRSAAESRFNRSFSRIRETSGPPIRAAWASEPGQASPFRPEPAEASARGFTANHLPSSRSTSGFGLGPGE